MSRCYVCSKNSTDHCTDCGYSYCPTCYRIHGCKVKPNPNYNDDMWREYTNEKLVEIIDNMPIGEKQNIAIVLQQAIDVQKKEAPKDGRKRWEAKPYYMIAAFYAKPKIMEEFYDVYGRMVDKRNRGVHYNKTTIDGYDDIIKYLSDNKQIATLIFEKAKNEGVNVLPGIVSIMDGTVPSTTPIQVSTPEPIPPIVEAPKPVEVQKPIEVVVAKPEIPIPVEQVTKKEEKLDDVADEANKHKWDGGVKYVMDITSPGASIPARLYHVGSEDNYQEVYTRPYIPFVRKSTGPELIKPIKVSTNKETGKKEIIVDSEDPSDRMREIYSTITKIFKFPSKEVAKVFFSTWLVKDGSTFLRGVPGTGKTTLIEIMSYSLCNPIDFKRAGSRLKPDGTYDASSGYSLKTIDTFLKSKWGSIGIAKHNPDKLPNEVLYRMDVRIKKQHYGNAKQNPRKEVIYVPNPGGMGGAFVELDVYDFKPYPRQIVTAPIKFQNEANRMSKSVQDACLGLLAEKQVEYMGETFRSPEINEFRPIAPGALTFLDTNPHLDQQGKELDPAFLDRIDYSIWMPSPGLYNRTSLASSTPVRNKIAWLLNSIVDGKQLPSNYKPFSYEELTELWEDVERVEIDEKLLYKIAVYTQMFSMTFRRYNPKYVSPSIDEIESLEKKYKTLALSEDDRKLNDYFIDKSLIGFKVSDAISSHPTHPDVMLTEQNSASASPEAFVEDIIHPLAMRAQESLIRLVKAYAWFSKVIEGSKGKPTPTEEDVLMLLPYVIDHRIGVHGSGNLIKTNFLNIFDYIRNYMIPKYIIPMNERINPLIDGYIEVVNEVKKYKEREEKIDIQAMYAIYIKHTQTVSMYSDTSQYIQDMKKNPIIEAIDTMVKEFLMNCEDLQNE